MRRYLLYATHSYAWEILRPLQAAIHKRGDEAAWFIDGMNAAALRSDEQRLHTAADIVAWNPTAVFVPGNQVPYFFPGIKVQVFHGFGIEKKGHFRIRGWFDLYCTHGPLTTRPFEALARRHGHFTVVETGWPKMDPLFRDAVDDGNWRKAFAYPQRPLILYAPTFSPSLTSAPALAGEIERLAATHDWNWLVKFHPKMERSWLRRFEGMQCASLQLAQSPDILSMLRAADLLVSDTSSVVAEFLLLDKPAVTFRNSQPGEHLVNFLAADQLESTIERALTLVPAQRSAARAFAAAMHPWRDGRSSERVLDAVETFIRDDTAKHLKRKPLNLWRKLRMRWRY